MQKDSQARIHFKNLSASLSISCFRFTFFDFLDVFIGLFWVRCFMDIFRKNLGGGSGIIPWGKWMYSHHIPPLFDSLLLDKPHMEYIKVCRNYHGNNFPATRWHSKENLSVGERKSLGWRMGGVSQKRRRKKGGALRGEERKWAESFLYRCMWSGMFPSLLHKVKPFILSSFLLSVCSRSLSWTAPLFVFADVRMTFSSRAPNRCGNCSQHQRKPDRSAWKQTAVTAKPEPTE